MLPWKGSPAVVSGQAGMSTAGSPLLLLVPGRESARRRRWATLGTVVAAILLLTTACGTDTFDDASTPTMSVALPNLTEEDPQATAVRPAGGAIRFRRLTLDDGLSQSTINCIVQDAQGFMWFGTQDGLNRYDGYTFRVYRQDPDDATSLSNNYIMGCEKDQRDVMWVVTRDGTLHRYDPETDDFVRYELPLDDPLQQMGSELQALHGDREGRLWIGTHGDGVLRYDPAADAFTTYRSSADDPTTLSHRIVTAIYEDDGGTIWVGTEGGLNRYDAETDTFVRYPYRDFPPGGYQYDPPVHWDDPAFQPDNPDALASPAVTALLEDHEGRLWVGTRYGGLNRLDRDRGTFEAYAFDPAYDPANPDTFSGNSVRSLLEDHQGGIWVASAHWNADETRTFARLGLERLDPATGAITRYTGDPDDACSLPHDAVMSMYEDRRDTLWIHTFAGGLEMYDRERDCFIHHGHDPGDDRTLGDDGITRFYEDDGGGLWLGTELGGVSYHNPAWAKFAHFEVAASGGERGSNNSIWHIAPSPGAVDAQGHVQALWVATFAGLNHWDRSTNAFTYYEIDPQLPDVIAYAVYEDPKRARLWLGTQVGLERADLPAPEPTAPLTAPSALTFTRILTRTSASSGFVLDLHPAGEDHLWLAHHGVGLSLFDLASEEVVTTYPAAPNSPDGPSDNRIMDIVPGHADTLWLTTQSGVDHFDPATETFVHYVHKPDDPGSVADRVLAVAHTAADTVWLGTDGEGLQRLDPATGRVTAWYRQAQGLPNNVVYSMLPDAAGDLWLTTNNGLSRFDPTDQTFSTYTTDDGLQSNEFNWGTEYRAPDGEFFFGGVNGINAFYPDSVRTDTVVPRVVITEIVLGPPGPQGAESRDVEPGAPTQPANFTNEIALTHRDRILSFEFAALHYTAPERNTYAYMLAGFDEDWHYAGSRRFATYTNLPPGRYVFWVKAANGDGVWNEQGTQLAVTVAPPFWATWWFRGLLGVLLVGSVASGYRLRVRAVEARSRELEGEVADRTKELRAVNAIAGVVSRSLDLDVILSDALDTALEVMGVEAGGIYLLSKERGSLGLAVHRGLDLDVAADIDNLGIGEGFSGQVAASGEPVIVQDIARDGRLTRLTVKDAALRALAVVPVGAKGQVLGTLFAATQGSRSFSDDDIALLVAIGQQIGVAVENARLYEDTRARLAQLSALQETTTAVAGTLELAPLLHLIIRQATDLLQARGGILNMVDWDAEEDRVVAATGSAAPSLGQSSRLNSSLSGWCSLHRQAVLANELRTDDRVDRAGLASLEAAQGESVTSAAVAPLTVKGEVVGTLVLIDRQGGREPFTEEDLDLLQTFANQAGTAIENARLYEQARRLAVVEERQRLARELHDSVTQALYGVTLYAEATSRQLASGQAETAADYLRELRDTAWEALREMRLLIFELRPAILESEGLVAALRARLEAVEERAGLGVSLHVEGEAGLSVGSLPPGIEEGLYRIAQEALNNATKHACAQHVSVTLERDENRILLEIADDGIGFDPDTAVKAGGLGLDGMIERATEMGGELTLDSAPGHGTRVRVEVAR